MFYRLWFYSVLLSWFIFIIFTAKYWFSFNRLSALLISFTDILKSSFPPLMVCVFVVACTHYAMLMATANIPGFTVPIMFYSYALFNALLIWIPIILYALITNFKGFISHMLPYGAPVGLMLFLPLVEIFSQLIRPLTLTIRFATNLSAGHIMMFMFSYFSLLSAALAPFLYIVLIVLLVIEVFIAFLQSYIFVTLLGLYLAETI